MILRFKTLEEFISQGGSPPVVIDQNALMDCIAQDFWLTKNMGGGRMPMELFGERAEATLLPFAELILGYVIDSEAGTTFLFLLRQKPHEAGWDVGHRFVRVEDGDVDTKTLLQIFHDLAQD